MAGGMRSDPGGGRRGVGASSSLSSFERREALARLKLSRLLKNGWEPLTGRARPPRAAMAFPKPTVHFRP